jgi:hypothetical protein
MVSMLALWEEGARRVKDSTLGDASLKYDVWTQGHTHKI